METIFQAGETYYTTDGHEVEYVAPAGDGRHIVVPLFDVEDHEGPIADRGEPIVVTRLYGRPPRARLDEGIKELCAKIDELRAERDRLARDVREVERDNRDRLDRLKKYKGLERLEDFVEGRVTHAVVGDYGGYTIKTLKEALAGEDCPRDLRLVSLFGRSNGDLLWRVNRYYDDSGSHWRRIELCQSEAEAEAVRRRLIAEDLAAAKHDHQKSAAIRAALAHVVPVPDDMLAEHRAAEARRNTKMIADLRERIAHAQSQIDAIESAGGDS